MDSRSKGLMLVFATAMISGVSIFVNKFGVGGFDPFVFTSLKNLSVGLALLAGITLFTRFHELKTLSSRQWLSLVAIGILGGSVPFLLFYAGLTTASAATASFIHKTLFVWVAVFAFLFLGERLSRSQLLGAVALLGGLAIFSGFSTDVGTGELMIFMATILWAGELVLSKNVMKGVSPLTVMWSRMFFGSFVLVAFLAFTGRLGGIALLSMEQWSWVGLTSLFLLAYVATFYSGLSLIKASEAAAVLLFGSLVTSLLSLLSGASVPETQLLGGAVMVVGLALLSFRLPEVVTSASRFPQE